MRCLLCGGDDSIKKKESVIQKKIPRENVSPLRFSLIQKNKTELHCSHYRLKLIRKIKSAPRISVIIFRPNGTSFFQSSVALRTFFVSRLGDRDGVYGRDVCVDEDENQGLSQPRRSEGSFFFHDFFVCDGTTDSSAFFALYCPTRSKTATDLSGGRMDGWTRRDDGRCVIVREIHNATRFSVATFTRTTSPFHECQTRRLSDFLSPAR